MPGLLFLLVCLTFVLALLILGSFLQARQQRLEMEERSARSTREWAEIRATAVEEFHIDNSMAKPDTYQFDNKGEKGLHDEDLHALLQSKRLHFLRRLVLEGRYVRDRGLDDLVNLNKLEALELVDCECLTNGALLYLATRNLKSLRIIGETKMTDAGVKGFSKAHPECKVSMEATHGEQIPLSQV